MMRTDGGVLNAYTRLHWMRGRRTRAPGITRTLEWIGIRQRGRTHRPRRSHSGAVALGLAVVSRRGAGRGGRGDRAAAEPAGGRGVAGLRGRPGGGAGGAAAAGGADGGGGARRGLSRDGLAVRVIHPYGQRHGSQRRQHGSARSPGKPARRPKVSGPRQVPPVPAVPHVRRRQKQTDWGNVPGRLAAGEAGDLACVSIRTS